MTLRPVEAWVGEHGVTERERHFYYFNHWPNKIFFFLSLMNSAHLSINVHCSSGAKKKIDLAPWSIILVFVELKFSNIAI